MQDKKILISNPLPNIPWQDKPVNCIETVWRYDKNPIITKDVSATIDSIYNSAVVPFNDEYAGVFRCDDRARNMTLRAGRSKDGINFEIDDKQIEFICDIPEISSFIEGYDPRVVKIDEKYYVTWCNNYHGYTIGFAYTEDFKRFFQMENSYLPFNRNGVLFPRKINGEYLMLNRPSDTGHTPFGDIFISHSKDLTYWGKHRYVMGPKKEKGNWQNTKIGAGPIPIETTEGWLMFYHGVINTCNGFTYSMGAAILDINEPWKVLYRTRPYLLSPDRDYEYMGNTPNVVFPCAALTDSETGRIAIYYGCADKTTGLAFCMVNEVIDFIKANSEL